LAYKYIIWLANNIFLTLVTKNNLTKYKITAVKLKFFRSFVKGTKYKPYQCSEMCI